MIIQSMFRMGRVFAAMPYGQNINFVQLFIEVVYHNIFRSAEINNQPSMPAKWAP